MKQLKFMLAAATAIGLATAAQADVQLEVSEIDSETFESADVDDTIADLTGFTYEGSESSYNESVVVAGGANSTSKALKVNTGTEPILRKIDADGGNSVSLDATGVKKVYIDTMVQFTVTPNDDPVTAGDDDKLMIYLKEDLTDTAAPKTNLVVKAGYKGADDLTSTDYVLDIDGKEILPGVWYNLKVVAYGNVACVADGIDVYPAFEIYVDGTLAKIANSGTSVDLQQSANVPIFVLGSYVEQLSAGTLVLSMKSNVSALDYVGFAGEGLVDELVFSHDVEPQTTVDFTFVVSWDTGISAVTYTIDNGEATAVPADGFAVPEGATVQLAVTLVDSEWTKLADGTVLKYENVADKEDITLTTVKIVQKEDAEGNIVVNENATVTEIQESAGITGGYFGGETTATSDEFTKVLNWKKSKGGATADINSITFNAAGDPSTDNAKAYLLDCDVEEVATEEAKFVFTGFDVATGTFKVGTEKNAADGAEYGNGKVEVRGATALDATDAFENPKKDGDAFFKAFLVKYPKLK